MMLFLQTAPDRSCNNNFIISFKQPWVMGEENAHAAMSRFHPGAANANNTGVNLEALGTIPAPTVDSSTNQPIKSEDPNVG